MNQKKHRMICVLFLCFLLLFVTGCNGQLQSARLIRDVKHLDGRKIGVEISTASDYLLSPRDGKDLFLYRYDTTADMLMALYYRQLDAAVVGSMEWEMLNSSCKGLRHFPDSIGTDKSIMYVSPEFPELCDEFNTFLREFKKTDTYADLVNRQETFDGQNYVWNPDLSMIGNGETICVAFTVDDMYPNCFITSEGHPSGFDVELMVHFANAYNYRIDFVPTSYDDLSSGIWRRGYQMVFGGLSTGYAEDAQRAGVLCTDSYYDSPMYLVEIDDYEALRQSGINTGEYARNQNKGGVIE